MSQYGTHTGTEGAESLSQEQQNLMNLASNVAAEAARAVVEARPLAYTQAAQQGAHTGQTFPQAQQALAQQTRQAQAQQPRQAQAQQPRQAQAQQPRQAQAQQPRQAQAQQPRQATQQSPQGQAASPSFSQQAKSPQLSALQQQASQAQAQQQYSPAVDVIESNEEVHVFADLPGVDSDSIEIQASNNTISLSAERIESQQEDQQGNPIMSERGRVMQRQIQLPVKCEVDEASASWDKGVVTITLPKVEAESTKRIGVE